MALPLFPPYLFMCDLFDNTSGPLLPILDHLMWFVLRDLSPIGLAQSPISVCVSGPALPRFGLSRTPA